METKGNDLIPSCHCGGGKMLLKCAGPDAHYTGCYYYTCPTIFKHERNWMWCDEYHKNDPAGVIPDYVLNQVVVKKPTKKFTRSEASQAREVTVASEFLPPRRMSDLEVLIAFLFMSIVIFILGIILGKSM